MQSTPPHLSVPKLFLPPQALWEKVGVGVVMWMSRLGLSNSVFHSQYSDQLCISPLTAPHYKKELLWPAKSSGYMAININIERTLRIWPLSKLTITGWFYPRTCDIISHGLLIRITVPSKKFPPVEYTPNPTVTLYQLCHYYTNGHVLSGQLVLQGPALGKTSGVSFLLGRLHRTFWNYESQPVGRKFPAQFEIDFSMSYNQSIQCLQQCGLTM